MTKLLIMIGVTVGSIIGAYIPVWLFGASELSAWSILFGTVGSFVGLWAGYRLAQEIEG